MTNTFFYDDGQENVYNRQRMKVFDLMEDILTLVLDPKFSIDWYNLWLDNKKLWMISKMLLLSIQML